MASLSYSKHQGANLQEDLAPQVLRYLGYRMFCCIGVVRHHNYSYSLDHFLCTQTLCVQEMVEVGRRGVNRGTNWRYDLPYTYWYDIRVYGLLFIYQVLQMRILEKAFPQQPR